MNAKNSIWENEKTLSEMYIMRVLSFILRQQNLETQGETQKCQNAIKASYMKK